MERYDEDFKRESNLKKITLEEAQNYQPFDRRASNVEPMYYTIEITKDGWEEVRYYTEHNRVDPDNGEIGSEFVYIMANKHMPKIYKIGFTTSSPQERAEQLYKNVSGVPCRFEVKHYTKCFNGLKIEKAVHRHFKRFRINTKREWFEVDLEEAIQVIKQMKEQYG